MIRRLSRALLMLLLLGVVLITSAALLALQWQSSLPAPPPGAASATSPWAQAREWMGQVRSHTGPGGLRSVWLREADVNNLLDQLATSPGRPVRGRVAFQSGRAELQASLPMRRWLTEPWLNVRLAFDLTQANPGQLPPLAQAQIGSLPLPPRWVEWAVHSWLDREFGAAWRRLPSMLRMAQGHPQSLWLSVQVQREDLAQAVSELFNPAERAALQAQVDAWDVLAAQSPAGRYLGVEEAMQHQARAALVRVNAHSADAGVELHALLMHLSLHAVGRSSARLLAPLVERPPQPPLVLVLAQRTDMAQHFLLSTMLAWQGGQRFSNALGLGKELADARGGSGFSFNDLAGDLAGTRFGQSAQRNPARMLAAMAAGLGQSAFFPEVADLPEFMPEAHFRTQYGGVGEPSYEAQMNEIRRRVGALPLYATPP